MMLMHAQNLVHFYGIREILKNVDVEIHRGDRIGLVGPNGEGKSTLMRILAGVEQPEEGHVVCYGSLAYVPQALETPEGLLVSEWLTAQEVTLQGSLMKELGLSEHVFDLPTQSLSGGEQTKIALLAALARETDMLLLDEPTNHLDMGTVEWLEKRLKSSRTALLVISHDRRFLDEVTKTTWELKKCAVTPYPGSYKQYAEYVAMEEERIRHDYEEYEKKKEQLEEAVRRQMQWADKGNKGRKATDSFARCLKAGDQKSAQRLVHKAKAMERRLERLEPKEKPENRIAVNASFLGIPESERPVLIRGEEVTFAYEGRKILDRATFEVERGDRIALVGPNGAGKSTLLKMFSGHLVPQTGQLRITPTAQLGYFDQVFETLDLDHTLLDDVLDLDGLDKTTARLFLGSFLFKGDEVFRQLSSLSYGERVRFVFAKLILSRANTLILDEPSNHLDIGTREKIEESLLDYPGAFVCASHDRYFLEKMANKVWELQDGRLKVYPCGFSEYLERKKEEQEGPKTLTKKQRQQKIREELLVLETRIANLSWELSTILDAAKKQEMEQEFIRISRQANQLRLEAK
jgi:ATPase subunit of ABC transporter with duplicated ATPase domains